MKERVLTTLASRQPDRVPIDYDANAGIDRLAMYETAAQYGRY